MFIRECNWIKDKIAQIQTGVRNVLDIGSESKSYRTVKQKYIAELYEYMEAFGINISTLDINPEHFPDILVDISSDIPKDKTYDLVLATSVLEHIFPNKFSNAVENIKSLVSPGKYLIVTVPYKLGLHDSPIDNGFRPDLVTLWDLFKNDFDFISGNVWVDEHYREPYISNPSIAPFPEVTGLFMKRKG